MKDRHGGVERKIHVQGNKGETWPQDKRMRRGGADEEGRDKTRKGKGARTAEIAVNEKTVPEAKRGAHM